MEVQHQVDESGIFPLPPQNPPTNRLRLLQSRQWPRNELAAKPVQLWQNPKKTRPSSGRVTAGDASVRKQWKSHSNSVRPILKKTCLGNVPWLTNNLPSK